MTKTPKKRTEAWLGTYNLKNQKHVKEIASLRKSLSRFAYGWKYRIKLQGRLGPRSTRSPAITEKYRRKSCNWRANYAVELKDAAYVDAYLYKR